jgi:hypothetical protein
MTDAIDLQSLLISRSPDIAGWMPTVAITRVRCSAAGGFVIDFDRPIPASWKWPSNPAVPSDNFQWTAWLLLQIGGLWQGAGFVQMWDGRAQGTRALPPLFADVDGVPGYRNWWGDPRRLWPEMVDYVPADGDQIGILVTAGNARLTEGITSVAERSNVVLFTIHADDSGDVAYGDVVPPIVIDPPPVTTPAFALVVLAALNRIESKLDALAVQQNQKTDAIQQHINDVVNDAEEKAAIVLPALLRLSALLS